MIIIPTLELAHPDAPQVADARRPAEVLEEWAWDGFGRVQLVEPSHPEHQPMGRPVALDLLRESQLIIQVSGDIRSADDIEALATAGAAFVVLGSRAMDDPDWLASCVTAFPDMLIVETAAHERRVRARGWVRTMPVDARDVASELAELPLAGLIVSFPGDSPIEHVDLALVEDLAEALPFPLLVKGGVATLTTLRDLDFRGIAAAIIDGATLTEAFDARTLARDFAD